MSIRNLVIVLFVLMPASWATAAEPAHVIADFASSVDYPLSKSKFAVFDSGMVRPDRYERDAKSIEAIHPESMRIDIGWGARWIGWKTPAIDGSADAPRYDFAEMDRTAIALRSAGVPVYWSYCYTPRPLQPKPGDYRGMPTDLKAFGRIIGDVTAHYRDLPGGDPVGYHEIGNEPDNRDFFTGTRDDYLKLYDTGATAVRKANPAGLVGGPALAFDPSWVDPFLDQVTAKKLPLDFFSFHYYPGIPFKPADLPGRVRLMENALDKRPGLRTVQLHLNEFNSFKIDYPLGGRQDRISIAPAFLHDLKWFLEQPGLTRVSWAQFLDSGGGNFSGMVSIDGHRKALWNALSLYNRMAVDRRRLTTDSDDLEGLASGDGSAADVLLWNRTQKPRKVSLHLIGMSSKRGRMARLDADHGSRGDNPASEAIEEIPVSVPDDDNLGIELPAEGVVWIELGEQQTQTVPDGRIVRDWQDYPSRSGRSYVDVDKRRWTIRAGAGGDADASCTAGFTVQKFPASVDVRVRSEGFAAGGLLAMRVDFHTPGGKGKSVLFHGPGHFESGESVSIPWGTGRPADSVVSRDDFEHFRLSTASLAPADWDGGAEFTLLMRKAGPVARASVSVGK